MRPFEAPGSISKPMVGRPLMLMKFQQLIPAVRFTLRRKMLLSSMGAVRSNVFEDEETRVVDEVVGPLPKIRAEAFPRSR